jgi:hypothetical protein
VRFYYTEVPRRSTIEALVTKFEQTDVGRVFLAEMNT